MSFMPGKQFFTYLVDMISDFLLKWWYASHVQGNMLSCIFFIVLANWNNSLQ
jgi:hypothetical protein